MTDKLRVKRNTPTAILPKRAEPGSVGYDLYADMGGGGMVDVIGGRGPVRVSTGISAAPPAGCYIRIAPRSGLAVNQGIDVLAGVIDPSYRGTLVVALVRHGDGFLTIKHGDRIAQMVVERVETPEVEDVDALDETERGAAGFGSSGR